MKYVTRIGLGFLSCLLLLTFMLPMFPARALAADTITWSDAKGVDNQANAVAWSSRLAFLSPNKIRDSVTGVIYQTSDTIFGNGDAAYLNDGDGTNSDYWYTPREAGKVI